MEKQFVRALLGFDGAFGIAIPKVTTSVGLASAPPERRDMDLGRIADERNQVAKKAGRNRVVAAEPSTRRRPKAG